MNFLNDPKYKSIRVVLVIIVIASAGWFVASNMNQSGVQTGMVLNYGNVGIGDYNHDTDNDGIVDSKDSDDDNDSIVDSKDSDDDNDGILDVNESKPDDTIIYYNTEQKWTGSCNGSNAPTGVDLNDWMGPTVTITNAAGTFSSDMSVENANTNAQNDAKIRAQDAASAGCYQVYRCREDQTAVASCPAGTAPKLGGNIFQGTILDITYGRDGDNYTVSVLKSGYSALNPSGAATSRVSVEAACAKLMESAQQKADDLATTNCEPI